MIYHLDQDLLKTNKEGVVRSEIGGVILRLETKSFTLGTKVHVFDKYHVEIGQIRKGVFQSGFTHEILYDDRIVASLLKKRSLWRKRLVLSITDFGDFVIKGDLSTREFVLQRRGKIYARSSKKLSPKPDQFGLETKDERLKYCFLCTAVIATL